MRNKMILALWGIAKSMGCENNLKKNQIPADNVYSLTTQTIGVIMSKFDCYLFNSSPIAACIIQKKFIQLANDALLKLLGYTFNELKMFPLKRIILKPDYVRVMKNELDRLAARNSPVEYDFTIVDAHNNLIKVRGFFSVIKFFGKPATFVQILSIQQFNHENDLISDTIENCIKSMEIIASLPEVIFEMDTKGYVNFANVSASNFFGATLEDYQKGINALDYVIPADRERMKKNMGLLLGGDKVGISEYTIQKKDGKTIPAIIHSTPVIRNGCPIGLRGVIIDITERKEMEARIIRLSQCDILTGLYNRSYFDNELQKTKNSGILFGLVICDLDGLKLINDTMGHRKGDLLITSAANAMKDTFRSEDLIARIGGDEFAIILYNTDETMIKNLIRCLQLTIIHLYRDISEIPLTLSCGYAIRKNALVDPEVVFKEADNNMFKQKLFHNHSNRSAIIQTLSKALEARDFITEGHAERLQSLILKLAARIGLSESRRTDLRLFAQFHDIGKVGIPDRILYKNGPLTKQEKEIMQRHSEIGFRIAQTAPDLAPIADWILKHHEWWNGNGYPLGLKGEEIPLECRILSIVDAFDAMTNDRFYRKALPVETAINEIKKYGGIQFDPELVPKFLEVVDRR